MKEPKPLSFEDWKSNREAQFQDDYLKSINRLHNIDLKKEFEEMLKVEYKNYLSDFNGNWLLDL